MSTCGSAMTYRALAYDGGHDNAARQAVGTRAGIA